ncbi:hypothetical protein SIO70_19900 [Chitinophaga sancti]|uniref:hypothetical protein n=1 Tax=Chitinophaga sancti TaxID=1004 RepID=UPI002A756C5E|nr:hypothetical protein [Chitinophaga sancti]WPQ60618.1 hypothetical protein SIO70_19900 [Chitinophaga sancti]
MEIIIRKIGNTGVCVELPMCSATPLVRLWKERMVTDLLLTAFSNRPATFVCVNPAPAAIAYEFPYQLVVSGGNSYLVIIMAGCEYQDLVKIGESADMTQGLLTVVAGTDNYQFKNYFPDTDEAFLQAKDELFLCSPDGYRVYWLNANREYSEILDAINDIAAFYELVTVY